MRNALRNDLSFERALAHRNKLGKRTKRTRRQFELEPLESRVVLSYTFSYAAPFATVIGSAAVDSLVIDDSTSTAASTYTLDTGTGPNFPITGPGINFQEPSGIVSGGITLKGSSGADIYNVLSAFSSEPVNVVGGASTGNVVNVGSNPGTPSSSTLGNIQSLVSVADPTGFAT